MNGTDWRTDESGIVLPSLVPPAFARLIEESDGMVRDALRRQIEPSPEEELITADESPDPLGEARYLVTPRLVHQYPNRVLALTTGRCLGHCRYCFRRNFTARLESFLTADEQAAICAYLVKTPAVREILVSGGDPMTVPLDELFSFLHAIRAARPDILIRLCTRAPVFAPELFSPSFLDCLSALQPLWVITHINHPAELGRAQTSCLEAVRCAGISQQSQTVLLRGVNDTPDILAELFHRLVCLGVKPGYLFQCDLAPGTASFRLTPQEGMTIWRHLRNLLSGLSLPEYAVDLPGGGGKFPLSVPALADCIMSSEPGSDLKIRGIDGKVYTYPGSKV